jgi:hypothetical protein
MADQLTIINKALGHISVAPIASISESSPAAQLANLIWDSCRKEVLRGNPWSFAQVIETLSTVNYTIATQDWTYAYGYPSECVLVSAVYWSARDKYQKFRVIYDTSSTQNLILSNTVDAVAEYTYDITDTTIYDSAFVNAFSYHLAANMAKPLTGDIQLAGEMMKVYNAFISDAQRLSSYESDVPNNSERSSFVEVRSGTSIQGSENTYGQVVRHPNG